MKLSFKLFLFYALFSTNLHAIERSEKLFECTKIFEARKEELLVELERIDEQRQSLESLKIATDELLNKKAKNLDERESKVEAKLAEIADLKANSSETANDVVKATDHHNNSSEDRLASVSRTEQVNERRKSNRTCDFNEPLRNLTFRGGQHSGKFEMVAETNDITVCIQHCCNHSDCDVALLLGNSCFMVKCKSHLLCEPVPAKNTKYNPVTAYRKEKKTHISIKSESKSQKIKIKSHSGMMCL